MQNVVGNFDLQVGVVTTDAPNTQKETAQAVVKKGIRGSTALHWRKNKNCIY